MRRPGPHAAGAVRVSRGQAEALGARFPAAGEDVGILGMRPARDRTPSEADIAATMSGYAFDGGDTLVELPVAATSNGSAVSRTYTKPGPTSALSFSPRGSGVHAAPALPGAATDPPTTPTTPGGRKKRVSRPPPLLGLDLTETLASDDAQKGLPPRPKTSGMVRRAVSEMADPRGPLSARIVDRMHSSGLRTKSFAGGLESARSAPPGTPTVGVGLAAPANTIQRASFDKWYRKVLRDQQSKSQVSEAASEPTSRASSSERQSRGVQVGLCVCTSDATRTRCAADHTRVPPSPPSPCIHRPPE